MVAFGNVSLNKSSAHCYGKHEGTTSGKATIQTCIARYQGFQGAGKSEMSRSREDYQSL
jgi:hypothetical protein